MPANGKPHLRMGTSGSRRALDHKESGHYDTCESPYLYGCVRILPSKHNPQRRVSQSSPIPISSKLWRLACKTMLFAGLQHCSIAHHTVLGHCCKLQQVHRIRYILDCASSSTDAYYMMCCQVRVLPTAAGPSVAAGW